MTFTLMLPPSIKLVSTPRTLLAVALFTGVSASNAQMIEVMKMDDARYYLLGSVGYAEFNYNQSDISDIYGLSPDDSDVMVCGGGKASKFQICRLLKLRFRILDLRSRSTILPPFSKARSTPNWTKCWTLAWSCNLIRACLSNPSGCSAFSPLTVIKQRRGFADWRRAATREHSL